MANIIFGDLRNYWKNVSDWVTGSISNILPKVQISEGDNTLKVNSDGAVFMAVDTQEAWQSNGTTWVVI